MKRLVIWYLLALVDDRGLAHDVPARPGAEPSRGGQGRSMIGIGPPDAVVEARREARRAGPEGLHEVRQALPKPGTRSGRRLHEARPEVREALRRGRTARSARRSTRPTQETPRGRDGIPVPIVPGTRVTEAVAEPLVTCRSRPRPRPGRGCQGPSPPAPPALRDSPAWSAPAPPQSAPLPGSASQGPRRLKPEDIRVITGQVSATEERARNEARAELEKSRRMARAAERAPVLEARRPGRSTR